MMLKKILGYIFVAVLAVSATFFFIKYNEEGPAEKAGKNIDETVNEIKDAFDTNTSKEGPAEKVGKKLDEMIQPLEE